MNVQIRILCVAMTAACSLLAGEESAPPKKFDFEEVQAEVKALYLSVTDSEPAEARKAILKLYELCKKGEQDRSDWNSERWGPFSIYYNRISYFGFRPVFRGYQSYVVQSKAGCLVLQRAIPRMIALMKDAQGKEIDYLLRQLQGRSPEQSDWSAWNSWWQSTGKNLFQVPAISDWPSFKQEE